MDSLVKFLYTHNIVTLIRELIRENIKKKINLKIRKEVMYFIAVAWKEPMKYGNLFIITICSWLLPKSS